MTDTNTAIENTAGVEEIALTATAPVQPKPKDFSNLRNRPFLVIKTIQRPQKRGLTSRKGWAEVVGNWAYFENPSVVDRVSDKLLREATVIIDVMRSTCVTSRFDNATDVEIVNHYMSKYGEQVKEAMGLWLNKMAKRMAQDPKFADTLAQQATAQVQSAAGIDAFEVVADQNPADQQPAAEG